MLVDSIGTPFLRLGFPLFVAALLLLDLGVFLVRSSWGRVEVHLTPPGQLGGSAPALRDPVR